MVTVVEGCDEPARAERTFPPVEEGRGGSVSLEEESFR
jgi:hypothetical protein